MQATALCAVWREEMKNLKIAAAVAIGAMAFATLATSVSATTITSPAGTPYTGTIEATNEGHFSFHHPIAKIECQFQLGGTVESHGTGVPAKVTLASLTTTTCTNSWHFTTISPGILEINWTSGADGSVSSTGMTTEGTRFGITCRYGTLGTKIGLIAGGSPATIQAQAALPFHGGSGLCGSGSATLTGSMILTNPSSLLIDA
jgi:hypothetical protein